MTPYGKVGGWSTLFSDDKPERLSRVSFKPEPDDTAHGLRELIAGVTGTIKAAKVKAQADGLEVFTSVPPAWYGVELYDWGRKGLRTAHGRTIKGPNGRKRKTFDPSWILEAGYLFVGQDTAVLREVRKITAEVWPVLKRKGKFWKRTTYICPARAIRIARERLQEKAGAVPGDNIPF